jgi:hypothetical protein
MLQALPDEGLASSSPFLKAVFPEVLVNFTFADKGFC